MHNQRLTLIALASIAVTSAAYSNGVSAELEAREAYGSSAAPLHGSHSPSHSYSHRHHSRPLEERDAAPLPPRPNREKVKQTFKGIGNGIKDVGASFGKSWWGGFTGQRRDVDGDDIFARDPDSDPDFDELSETMYRREPGERGEKFKNWIKQAAPKVESAVGKTVGNLAKAVIKIRSEAGALELRARDLENLKHFARALDEHDLSVRDLEELDLYIREADPELAELELYARDPDAEADADADAEADPDDVDLFIREALKSPQERRQKAKQVFENVAGAIGRVQGSAWGAITGNSSKRRKRSLSDEELIAIYAREALTPSYTGYRPGGSGGTSSSSLGSKPGATSALSKPGASGPHTKPGAKPSFLSKTPGSKDPFAGIKPISKPGLSGSSKYPSGWKGLKQPAGKRDVEDLERMLARSAEADAEAEAEADAFADPDIFD